MNYILFFVLSGLILGYSLVIGKQSSKGIKDDSDYFLSGRNLSFFKVFMTILATQLGGGAIIGTAEAAYAHGWKALSYSSGIALGLVFLSLGLGAKFRNMHVSTVPEIFKKIYKSDTLRTFASLLYILSMFLLLVAIGVSARKFALSIGANSNIAFVIFWTSIIIYTTTGGLNAVTKTDILQIIFVLVAFSITFVFLPNEFSMEVPSNVNPTVATNIPWINWLIIPCLSNMIGQDMAQRCFAARSPKSVPYAMIFAAIILVIATSLPTYLGILARGIKMPIFGSSVLIEIVSSLTNPYVTSIFAAAILMAILSTADSILCALSSNIALDFDFFKNSKKEKTTKSSKVVTIFVGISAMLCSFFASEVIPIMIISYEITISALFVPIMGALLLKSPDIRSAYGSCFTGFGMFLYFALLSSYEYRTICCILISSLVFIFSELFARKNPSVLP